MNKKQFLCISLIVIFYATHVNVCFAEKEHQIDKFERECCEKDTTTAGMANCTYKAQKKWDVEMNEYYKLLMGLLDKNGQDKLRESQRAWIKFRDAEIEAIKNLYPYDGTMYILFRAVDFQDITKERALKLKEYYEAVELEQVSSIELTKDDLKECIRTMEGDFDGDGIKEIVTLRQKNNKDLTFADYDLEISSKGKTFLIKDVLVGESRNIRGLEKIAVSSKINPFIGISYHCGAHSWGLDLYAFDGKQIKEIFNIGSDVPSIQLKDVDNDGENEFIVAERDWDSDNSVEDSIIDTFKYNGKSWKLISEYETKTKKFLPVNKQNN